ncbi:MAG: BtpA/SgcQ family protein [Archaeoglobaceae archaeon]
MEKTLICAIHLKPLPGSPGYDNFEDVVDAALRDAAAAEEGGADAVVVENFGDAPYFKEVGKEVVACMTVVAKEIRDNFSLGLGINVLRNDAIAALAIAKAVKADFVRVNQLYFGCLAPEGWLEGKAAEVLRYRRFIDCNAMIFADVSVKHARHFVDIEEYLENVSRAMPDALIVTGTATGVEPSVEDVRLARRSGLPVLVGSGVTAENVEKFAEYCEGFIVGTYVKRGGRIDAEKVRKLAAAVKKR